MENLILLIKFGKWELDKDSFLRDLWILTRSFQKHRRLLGQVRQRIKFWDVEGALNADKYVGHRPYYISYEHVLFRRRKSQSTEKKHPRVIILIIDISMYTNTPKKIINSYLE